MSVRLTTLPSGLRVVTDASGDLRTASLGVFVAAGSRHESEGEHGLSHLLEHMAFKGTRQRNARGDRRDDRERRRRPQRRDRRRADRLFRPRPRRGRRPRARRHRRHPHRQPLRPGRARAREERHSAGDRRGRGRARRFRLRSLHRRRLAAASRSAGRSSARRESVGGFDRAAIAAYLRRHYRAGATIVAAAGAVDHDRIVERAESLLAPLGASQGRAAARRPPIAAASRS